MPKRKKKRNLKVHFTSTRDDWETPQSLFEELDAEFKFGLDAACTYDTCKLKKYGLGIFTETTNALTVFWEDYIDPSCKAIFLNPPYGREIRHWVKKAYEESRDFGFTVVLLIPSRTDTLYWHDYIMPYAEVRFIKGRLAFEIRGEPVRNPKTNGIQYAPFPNAIVIFRGSYK